MSGKSIDQRAARTRGQLARALIALSQAGDIDSLGVGDIARTAGVGRSTFYAHFKDRDDFFRRSFAGMIGLCDTRAREDCSDDVLPVGHLMHHIAGNRIFATSVARSRALETMLVAGEARLRQIAEARLEGLRPDLPCETRRQMAVFLAGGLIGQMRLWLSSGGTGSPEALIAAHRALSAAVVSAQASAGSS